MKSRLVLIIIAIIILQALVVAALILLPKATFSVTATPIPTLVRATMPAAVQDNDTPAGFSNGQCRIRALNLIGAWISAGKPQSDPFEFTDIAGKPCQAVFETDVQPLFTAHNIWYTGAPSCSTCHTADVTQAAAQLSLADYDSILAGSRRGSQTASGQDILGDADTWQQSPLFIMIHTRAMPLGRPPSSPPEGPIVYVGTIQE